MGLPPEARGSPQANHARQLVASSDLALAFRLPAPACHAAVQGESQAAKRRRAKVGPLEAPDGGQGASGRLLALRSRVRARKAARKAAGEVRESGAHGPEPWAKKVVAARES